MDDVSEKLELKEKSAEIFDFQKYGFCPKCAAPLDSESVTACWNCDAIFDETSAWGVTTLPVCKFLVSSNSLHKLTPKRAANVEASKDLFVITFPRLRSVGKLSAKFTMRLFFGFLIWIGIGLLTIISAAPYGGGSKVLLFLFMIATIGLPIWALLAFVEPLSAEQKLIRDENKIQV